MSRVEADLVSVAVSDVTPLLQNHPGEAAYPVRRRFRYRGVMARRSAGRHLAAHVLITAALVAAALSAWRVSSLPFPDEGQNAVAVLVMVWIAVMLVWSFLRAVRSIGAPLADQERYWRLTQPPELTEHQRQILAIVLPHDLAIGGWNHSLEAWPCWSLLPDRTRRRYRDGRRGHAFATFDPVRPDVAREQLQRAFGITSAATLAAYVDELFTGRPATGPTRRSGPSQRQQTLGGSSASRELVDLAAGSWWAARLPDIAEAAGVQPQDVVNLLRPMHGRPAPLLWGDDAAMAIRAVRLAVAADLVTRDQAWQLMETPARVAFAIYPSWEKVWEAQVVARAATPGDDEWADVIARSRAAHAQALSCRWPNATLPLTPTSRTRPLPEGVRSGCGLHGG